MQTEYSQIAAYEGTEIADAAKRVLTDPELLSWLKRTAGIRIPRFVASMISGLLRLSPNPRLTIDKLLVMPFLKKIETQSTGGVTLYKEAPTEGSHFYITNHRDIILDAAFLSILLWKDSRNRPYLGVGNNLFGKPWIEDLMRICRCFAVIRNSSPRVLMHNAATLSAYIASLREKGESFWLAQRQGRAKDGNDITQPSVLKMLILASQCDPIDALQQLNLTPVSITYEYDPCDYLKAREMQLKRDNPAYKKSAREDMLNMQTGLKGQKGSVSFVVTPCINSELEALRGKTTTTEDGTTTPLSKNDILREAAAIIDRHIHLSYRLAWTNMAALDILEGRPNQQMEEYVQSRIDLIHIPNRDDAFLRDCLLNMYANPARNQRTAQLLNR